MFFMRMKSIKITKSIKSTKRKQATFFLLDIFIAHENVIFFVLHTKKAQKAQKNTKTQISE